LRVLSLAVAFALVSLPASADALATLIVKVKGEAEKTYKPGDAIFEPGNTVIEKFDNGSATEPAVFIANYLLGADDKEIIHFLDGGQPAK